MHHLACSLGKHLFIKVECKYFPPHDPAAMAEVGGRVSVVVRYDLVAIDLRWRSAKSPESFS